MRWLLLLLLAVLRMSARGEDEDRQMSNISKLKEKLLEKYDSTARPGVHHSNTTNVGLSLIPLVLLGLNEDRALMFLDTWLVMTWVDERLSWKPEEYGGLTYMSLTNHLIWKPDIVAYNSHSWNLDPTVPTHLLLYSDGDVIYIPPALFTTYCSLTPVAGAYPRETVQCNIYLGSWAHDGQQINLTMHHEPFYMDEYQDINSRWELLTDQVGMTRRITYYDCCEEPYIELEANIRLKRKYPSELEVAFMPCILVMTLTLTMFWIPSDSGKKIIIGCLSFLILTGLMTYVARANRSDRSAAMAVSFLMSTMYAVVASIILEVLVVNLSSLVGANRPPEFLINLLTGSVGKITVVFARWSSDNIPWHKIQLKEDSDQLTNHPTPKEEWILVATAIDRVLFVVFLITFASIHSI